ncbi:MAG: flagellar hook-length control protein FliK [Azovibrio sp.]|nr:flagellar hook-length control protein FliK [Azovibrio sp.]
MIPADVASRLRLVNDLVTQPTAPTQKLTDALSDFVPGQRVMATIQALLPNGTYRAMIAQRDITLALPFAAKAGDALELEVVDSNGKLALAVVAGNKQAADPGDDASVATRLTTTGRLIGDLLAGMDKEGGKRPQPAPLNNAQPVVTRFPENAADLAPALKSALSTSGMFYEAHQARWVQGKVPTETLLQEPQGRLSPAAHALQNTENGPPASAAANTSPAATHTASSSNAPAPTLTDSGALRVGMGQVIASELTPLVQQQLEALATNTYVWQGQIWPGQTMHWEIVEEDGGQQERAGENTAANWTTHLRLELPSLGGLDATLRLQGGKEIEITVRTQDDAARQRLNAANAPLQEQFETAGLKLRSLAITRHVRQEE